MEKTYSLSSTPKHGKQLAATLVSVLMLALFGGCMQSPKVVRTVDDQSQQEAVADEQEQALSFERIELKDTDCNLEYSLNILFPEANTPAAKAIREALEQSFYDTSTKFKPKSGENIRDFVHRHHQAMMADKRGIDNESGESEFWQWEFTIDTVMQTKRFINFAVSGFAYMGGVHGFPFGGGGGTFRLSDGKQITEFFKDPDDPGFRSLLFEGLCQYFNENGYGPATPDNLGDFLMVAPSELQLPSEAPCLTAEGVAITYSSDEIAAHCNGEPSFVIPYDQVMPYLTDEVRELIRP